MFNTDVANPLYYLFSSGDVFAYILAGIAVVTALVLLVRRNFKLSVWSIVAAAGMMFVAWDLHRVASTKPKPAMVYGSLRDLALQVNGRLEMIQAHPHDLTVFLSGFFVLALSVLFFRAVKARRILTLGALIIALTMGVSIVLELVRGLYSVTTPAWNTLWRMDNGTWSVLFAELCAYGLLLVIVLSARWTLMRAQRKARGGNPVASAAARPSTVR